MGVQMEKLKQCVKAVREKTDFVPEIALILGSGLGSYGEQMEIEAVVSYEELPGFPVSTVSGHAGRFLFGRVGGVKVVCMQGRVHLYEGYTPQDVVLPVRLMGMLGAKVLFLTNAAGGLGTGLAPGDLMMITDQIASYVTSPLIGENEEELGARFSDMSEIYSRVLRSEIRTAAEQHVIAMKEGVYIQFRGPQYESPAEIHMAGILGADAVGMSTAIEAIAAKHMCMQVCGISCITNLAAGISKNPLSHAEVQETANRIEKTFTELVTASIVRISARIADDSKI